MEQLSFNNFTHAKFPSNPTKVFFIEWFCKNGKMLFSRNKFQLNVTIVNMISNKVISNFYVFLSRVLNWIFDWVDGTSVITPYRNMINLYTKIF